MRKSKRTFGSSTRLLHAFRNSKRTFRSSTRLLQPLRKSKLSDALQGCYTLSESQTESPNLNKITTRFAEVETDSPKLYKASTRLLKVKSDSPKPYKNTTHFVEVQTDSPKLLQALLKSKLTPQNCTSLLYALRTQKQSEALQGCYTLC